MLSADDYKRLTEPESVALVGVTSRTGKGSNNPLEVMLEWGYQGIIYPVNPKGGTILGYRAYTSLLDVPEIPDLAVICAPRDAVPELLEQCCQKKVRLVIIVAQGFFDGDERGRIMQEEILKKAAQHGVRIVGPNTLGVVNNFNHFCTSFMRFINPPAATGILCQSGVFVVGAPEIMNGIGILIDTGNTTDLEVSDLLGHLVRDPRLKVINLHIESLRNGTKFMEAAKDAAAQKPVLVYKTGASPAGAVFASSHTGSLAGEYRVFETAFKQCDLLQIKDVEEMRDLNKVFTTFNGIKGNRIGVVSISGGAGVISVDACSRYGMELAKPSSHTMDLINELFPAWGLPRNPVDMWPAGMFHGYHQAYRSILEAFMDDPQIDCLLCITSSFLDKEGDFLDTTEMIREIAAKYPDKPITTWTYGKRSYDYANEFEKDHNVLHFYSVDRAVRALSALYRYHHVIKKKERRPVALPVSAGQGQAKEILAGKATGYLEQTDAFRLLEAYGIPTARWEKAANMEEALVLAEKIGYPVAMKVVNQDIIHKSDSGGVRLNIGNARQLEEAYTEMHRIIDIKHKNARLDGVLIQEFLDQGTELLLGCKKDPQFGPVVVFGSGGVFTEIMNDISLRIPPLSKEELVDMINETKAGKILAGARGTVPVDLEALTGCITGFMQLVLEHPSIAEVDINPLLAHGSKIVALDARIRLE